MGTGLARVMPLVVTALVFSVPVLAQDSSLPKIDHILLEVADMKKALAFYRDLLGLQLKSQSNGFTTLQSANVGVFLSSGHWDWDEKRPANARLGWGMYPHIAVADVLATIERARKARYRIAQEPRNYDWGTEAFVADPDGYVWALVNSQTRK